MKVRIDADERYPTYSIRERFGHEVEATQEQVERWAKAEEAYNQAQGEMDALWWAAEEAERAERARLKAEKEAAAKAAQKAENQRIARRNAKYEAARARLDNAEVYDAAGKPVGKVRAGVGGGLILNVDLGDDDE